MKYETIINQIENSLTGDYEEDLKIIKQQQKKYLWNIHGIKVFWFCKKLYEQTLVKCQKEQHYGEELIFRIPHCFTCKYFCEENDDKDFCILYPDEKDVYNDSDCKNYVDAIGLKKYHIEYENKNFEVRRFQTDEEAKIFLQHNKDHETNKIISIKDKEGIEITL